MNRPIAIRCSMRRGPVCRSLTQRGKDEVLHATTIATRPDLPPSGHTFHRRR
jgi:hypothetical protein